MTEPNSNPSSNEFDFNAIKKDIGPTNKNGITK